MEQRGEALVTRYKKNYGIPSEEKITEEMILHHWELEKQLTIELLKTTPENRWEVFERCYTKLYSELAWLNELSDLNDDKDDCDKYEKWIEVLGDPPKSIYEIGSGKGALLTYLAENDFDCKGTEITNERGQKFLADSEIANIRWGVSDGVNLEMFEPVNKYDVVITDQVIEHLHPDDILKHLEGAYRILQNDGKYIFRTPHRFTGPHDISRVFLKDQPYGMHLKEYTFRELSKAARQAGFDEVYYPFIPYKIRRIFESIGANKMVEEQVFGKIYLWGLLVVESLLSLIPTKKLRRSFTKGLKKICIFPDNISLAAKKMP